MEEKCDDNFQAITAFFSITLRLRNIKFGLHRVFIWVNIQKNFQFLCRTVSEKSAMLISSYHRIYLDNCATEEHEIWFAWSIHMG